MSQNVAGQVLSEVRQLGDKLDAKIDGFGARLDSKIDSVGEQLGTRIDGLDSKVERLHGDLLGRFEQLHAATEHTDDRLAEKIDALQVEMVRRDLSR